MAGMLWSRTNAKALPSWTNGVQLVNFLLAVLILFEWRGKLPEMVLKLKFPLASGKQLWVE